MKSKIFLTGMMGCGKSSVGRQLAQLSGWKFIDMDERIEREQGQSISAIFARQGEAAFRQMERELLARLASREGGAIIGTGGGAPLNPEDFRAMQAAGEVVYLDRPAERIAKDIEYSSRPVIARGGVQRLYEVYEQRKEIYARHCTLHFDNRYDSAQAAAQALWKILQDLN